MASLLSIHAAIAAFVAVCAVPARCDPVAFKDAAKIRSWDASDNRNLAEPRPEGRSVTWERLNRVREGRVRQGKLG